jgi:small-conductance mechanosensitive channel
VANKTETNPRWTELLSRGYNLRDKDGDVAVELYFKEAYITDFNQTKVTMEEVIKEAEQHWQEIMGDITHRLCRNCIEWRDTQQWKGNCNKHPWEHDRYSQDATATGCEDYLDKYAKYQAASAKEA